jgi:hypothetical protein
MSHFSDLDELEPASAEDDPLIDPMIDDELFDDPEEAAEEETRQAPGSE